MGRVVYEFYDEYRVPPREYVGAPLSTSHVSPNIKDEYSADPTALDMYSLKPKSLEANRG